MSSTNIKGPGSDDGLDALVREHAAQRVEEKKEIKVEHKSKTIEIMEQFRELLRNPEDAQCYLKDELDKTLTGILTPTEIGIAFQAMIYETENEKINNGFGTDVIATKIGVFTTKLIQNSYDAGYNDFMLATEGSPRIIAQIGYKLEGNEKLRGDRKMVRIKIVGDTYDLCHLSSYCEVDVYGEVRDSILGMGYPSKYCIFTFRDELTSSPSARNSIYKTTNYRALEKLVHSVLHGAYNQIVFINPDGTEEAVLRHTHDPSTGVFVNKKYYRGQLRHGLDNMHFSCEYKIIPKEDLQIKPIG